MQWLLRRVVHVAIAERPVLAIHLDQVDPDIFFSYARLRVYAVCHRAVKRFLHLDRAAGVPCHLYKYDPRRVGHAQVSLGRVDQFVRRMARDDLKLVVLRHFDYIDHGVVHDVADCLNDFRRCSLREIDSNEWHGLTSGLRGNRNTLATTCVACCRGVNLRAVLKDIDSHGSTMKIRLDGNVHQAHSFHMNHESQACYWKTLKPWSRCSTTIR